jgi:putative membrane protein
VSNTTPAARRRWWRRAAVAAVVLIPLAFAGLFVGALSQATTSIDRIPAAIVNSDTLVYQTAADGTKTPIFAGRQLVTELTGGKAGFDWTISNKTDAEAALKAGKVDAILTVPKDFSSSIVSLSSASPKQAKIAIHTDDAHSYLTGAVAQAVGDGMVSAFGKAVTQQYIAGIYSSVGTLGASLTKAADGATSLAGGASSLTDGLGSLASGAASAQSGATKLSSGIGQYTGGVDSLAGGLGTLSSTAANLTQLSQGIAATSAQVASLSAQLTATPGDTGLVAQLATASATLSALSAQNAQLSPGVAGGVAQSASGAAQLAGGSAGLRSGASSLAGGLGSLASGATSAQTGASQLTSGATSLATGLSTGAAQVPATDSAAAAKAAKVASDPIGLTLTRDNKIKDIGQVIATFFVPLGLWVGALAVFLVLRPVTRRALTSTAANGRLVVSTLARASIVTVAQAVLLVLLVHLAVGVPWSALPATFGFSLLMALAFTAFHYLLTIGFGRGGLIVSLFLLAIQVTSTGGLYPVQLLATPFQVISPFLPLTYGVQGMQGIIAGGDIGPILAAAFTLLAFGVGSVLVSMLAIRRTRRARALGLTPAFA